MSARVEKAGAAAVARLLDTMTAMAADELPAGVAIERVDGGVRLTGPRIALRWVEDVRLRGLAVAAAKAVSR